MAYTPTVWETGDVITAEKLNKMECGIEASNSYITIPGDLETISCYVYSALNIKTAYIVPRALLEPTTKFVEANESGEFLISSVSKIAGELTEADASSIPEGSKFLVSDYYLQLQGDTDYFVIADDANLGTGTGT